MVGSSSPLFVSLGICTRGRYRGGREREMERQEVLGVERRKNDDGGGADINVKNGRGPGGEEERGATNCTVLSGCCGLVGEGVMEG